MFEMFAPFLTSDFVGKLVRTGIQSAMGGLIGRGLITGDQSTQLAGTAGLVASLLWTAVAHSKAMAKYATPPNNTTGGLK